MNFKRFDVAAELQNLQSTPPKAPKPPKVENQISHFSHFRWDDPAKVQNSTQWPATPLPNYRALYEQMTWAIPEDFPLVDAWLCDNHPSLWRRIRELDDDLTRMEQELAPAGTYRAALNELLAVCQQAKSLRDGTWRALPIRSEVLGGELVWVAKDEEQARAAMGDGKAVYYADEFELLKGKSPEQIRDIHMAKLVFPGCRVVQ